MLDGCSQFVLEALKAITALLNSDILKLLSSLQPRFPLFASRPGLYEVLEHHIRLELLDAQGKQAVYYKRQKVRFLHNEVFAIQDQAWGDGDLFIDYKCSPGIPVDRYKEGYRWKILISLRGTRNKGDTQEFIIERTVRDGFTAPVGNFQTQVDHHTDNLLISVTFPCMRHPKLVTVIEQNTKRTYPLREDHKIPLSGERVEYQWYVSKPRLYEAYILHWEW